MSEFSSTIAVDAGHPCLAGHFPGRPIVPAVLLLDVLANALHTQLPSARVCGISMVKFLHPVLPAQPVQLWFSVDLARLHAQFRCNSGGRLVADGEFQLRTES